MPQTKANSKAVKKEITLEDTWPWILTAGGIIGFLASFILMLEKLSLLANPNYQPNCNLNPIISCGSVINTPQSHVFGFPNPLIGIAGFAVVITIGMMLLASRHLQRMKNWFWWGLQAGTTFGVIFVHWLFFQSVYQIQALCPYCMVVWAVTIVLFWYVTLHNIQIGVIGVADKYRKPVQFIRRHHGDILFVWFLLIALAILTHFWYYWKTLI